VTLTFQPQNHIISRISQDHSFLSYAAEGQTHRITHTDRQTDRRGWTFYSRLMNMHYAYCIHGGNSRRATCWRPAARTSASMRSMLVRVIRMSDELRRNSARCWTVPACSRKIHESRRPASLPQIFSSPMPLTWIDLLLRHASLCSQSDRLHSLSHSAA